MPTSATRRRIREFNAERQAADKADHLRAAAAPWRQTFTCYDDIVRPDDALRDKLDRVWALMLDLRRAQLIRVLQARARSLGGQA